MTITTMTPNIIAGLSLSSAAYALLLLLAVRVNWRVMCDV
jgi:hypothetical protein